MPNPSTKRRIIDTDVHPYVRGGLKALLEYMPRVSRERFAMVTHNATALRRNGSTVKGASNGHGPGPRDDEMDLTTNKWNPPNRYTNPHPGVKVGVLRPDATPPDGGLPGTDPEFVVKDLLDTYNIAAALLLPVASAGGGHVESNDAYQDAVAGQAYVSAVNNYFIENWLPVDHRFVLALQLLTRDPEGSVREIKRHQAKHGVAAVFMPLTNQLMGDRFYYPIYKAAQEFELPIVIHPFGAEGNSLSGPVLAGGVPATYLERHIGLTQVGQANLSSLILNGVFEKFPRLRIIFAELGFTWAAPLIWRLDRDWKRMKEEAPALKKLPSEYFKERVRFTTQPMEEPEVPGELAALLDMMYADRTLMFSSDYPHWDNDHPLTTLAQLRPSLQDRIYWENAVETAGARLAGALKSTA